MGRHGGKYTQAARLMRMLDELRLHYTGISIRELSERFAVTERQIRRDIEALEVIGYATEMQPIPGEHARVKLIDPPLRTVQLSLRERYALLAVRRVFDTLEYTPLFEDVRSVYAKIANTLPPKERQQLDAFGERFVYLPDGGIKHHGRKRGVLDALLSGVLYRTRVDYEYTSQRDNKRKGVLAPYAMVLYRHGLYVIGKPEDAGGAPLVFAAERFSKAKHRRGDHFEVPKGFHVDKYFHGAFGIFVGDEPAHVVVEFDRETRDVVEARTWHPRQKLEPTKTGGVRLSFDVAQTTQVVPWVLSWGAHAKLVEPKNLAQDVAKVVARMAGK